MTTRKQYRDHLKNKLIGLEDGSYGDFEYSDAEYDTFLDLSVSRMFPSVYKRASVDNLTVVGYGSNSLGYVSNKLIAYDRVYLIEDALEFTSITGWEVRGSRIVGIDTQLYNTVNAHFTDAYVLPYKDDVNTAGIPTMFEPLINLGALVEALEARQDTGVFNEVSPRATGHFQETQLIDRLTTRYRSLQTELAMAQPGMRF